MTTSIRPLHSNILVKRVEANDKSPGGIIIPDAAKEKPVEGIVLAVGPGARNDRGEIVPVDVAVNDRVLFGKYAGTEIEIEGSKAIMISEAEILCVVEVA